MSAPAIPRAISPPIVPAPTTAALNTNMGVWGSFDSRRRGQPRPGAEGYRDRPGGEPGLPQLGRGLELAGETDERAPQRVPHGPPDEEQVGERPKRTALLELVVQRQRHPDAVLERRECHRLRAGHARVLDLGG